MDGRRSLDFLIGGGPLILGHAHPRLVSALQESVSKGTHHFELTDRTIELADRLVRYIPSAEAVRFTSSGSEATLHALRLARAATGKSGYVAIEMVPTTAITTLQPGTTKTPPRRRRAACRVRRHSARRRKDIIVLPYNDADAVANTLATEAHRVAAIIVEPYQRALTPVPGFCRSSANWPTSTKSSSSSTRSSPASGPHQEAPRRRKASLPT